MKRMTHTMRLAAVASATMLVLAACGSEDSSSDTDTDAGDDTPTTSNIDLKIGTALPQTGNLAFLGPPEEAGVGYAASLIEEADTGLNLEIVYGDSGDTDNKAYESEIPRLLGEDVSAIIGAASSGTSLQFIDQVVDAGVIQFSPANTSDAFTSYEDDGLYWRTAPSDVLQGDVLGNLIAADGAATLGMIVLNDSYGTGLAKYVTEAFEGAGGEDEVKAYIVTEGGASIDNVALLDYCVEQIPRFAVPRFIEAVQALAKTATNKIQKEPLRQAGVTPGTWDRESVGYKIARRV